MEFEKTKESVGQELVGKALFLEKAFKSRDIYRFFWAKGLATISEFICIGFTTNIKATYSDEGYNLFNFRQ